jgi:hypothetical protein
MKSCWRSADLDERDMGEPGLHVLRRRLDVLAGIRAARHQRRDVVLGEMLGTASKAQGSGSSAIMCQPGSAQRHSSLARRLAAFSSRS